MSEPPDDERPEEEIRKGVDKLAREAATHVRLVKDAATEAKTISLDVARKKFEKAKVDPHEGPPSSTSARKRKPAGRGLELPTPTPWPEAVALAEVLDGIVAEYRRYVVLPAHAGRAGTSITGST